MKTLPYFKWYPADAETDSFYNSLSDAELGFFHRCLNRSWLNGGLPADAIERALALRVKPAYHDRMWSRIGRRFVPMPGDQTKVVNPRQEEERADALVKSAKATKAVRTRYGRSTGEAPRAYASVFESASEKKGAERKTNGAEPFERFKEVFCGPIEEDTWQLFGQVICTAERLKAITENTPLWMRTKRYSDGFHSAKKYLQSGVWLNPPKKGMVEKEPQIHSDLPEWKGFKKAAGDE